MTYQLPPLNWLRAFESAARHQSFTAAANELGLTQTAVSYQVRSLEKTLGYTLFDRLPRSIALTDMGRAYLPSVRKAFGELSVSTAGLFGPKREKTLTIRCSSSFAIFWLAPRLPDFNRHYPDIDVRFTSSIWSEAGFSGEADVEIHYGDGRWSGAEMEIVLNRPIIPICAPHLVEDYAIKSVSDLVRLPHIDILGCETAWPAFLHRYNVSQSEMLPDTPCGIQTDNSIAGLEIAASGGGLIMLLSCFAERAIEDGRVVQPVDAHLPVDLSHYLLTPTDPGAKTPEIQAFRDWVMAQARGC